MRAGRISLVLALSLLAQEAVAESLVAARRLAVGTVITASDLRLDPEALGGAASLDEIEGLETRVTIYAGRPVNADDLGPPTLVDRNQYVTMDFSTGGLTITAEGRALGRGGEGEVIRVMNLASKSTVSARVTAPGRVEVLAE